MLLTTTDSYNYNPAKFGEFVVSPIEEQPKTNLNSLRIAPKTVKKKEESDPGYDQGRSVVNNNFFEDSGKF